MLFNSFKFVFIFFLALWAVNLNNYALSMKRFSSGGRLGGHHYGATLGIGFDKSYLSTYYDLKKRKEEKIETEEEGSLYKRLFFQSLSPGYILAEATYYPLIHLGTYLHERQLSFYRRFDLGEDFNLLRFVTDYYEEPWSFSLFLGELLPFRKELREKKNKQVGVAIMGYSLTYGTRKVKHYYSINDDWYELEWKLKGSKKLETTSLKWNFYIGGTFHNSREFYDSVKVSLYRYKINKRVNKFFSLENLSIDYVFQIPADRENIYSFPRGFFTLQKFILGKGFPSQKWKKFVFFSHLGVKWQRFKKSLDRRFESKKETDFVVFIVPSISW